MTKGLINLSSVSAKLYTIREKLEAKIEDVQEKIEAIEARADNGDRHLTPLESLKITTLRALWGELEDELCAVDNSIDLIADFCD